MRFVCVVSSLFVMGSALLGQTKPAVQQNMMQTVEHLKDFQAIEFRRYTVKQGQREHFATYFESFFPEAFEQLGAVAAGSFYERNNPVGFTWIRTFHTIDDRAKANASFYYGPVWKEHKKLVNGMIDDSDNVLLLRPLIPERSITILPAVDPVTEANGAHGVVVAEVFSVKPGDVDTFAQQAEPIFAKYRELGAREAGVLVTLDVPNNFPQLPIRTDGPYLVWFGILENEKGLQAFSPVAEESSAKLLAGNLLRTKPEIVVLDPTHRSRLRWLPAEQK